MFKVIGSAVCALILVTTPANAQTVRDKKSCETAVVDARQALQDATIIEKTRKEAEDLLQIAAHLCTQANFVFAENALAVVRGMAATE